MHILAYAIIAASQAFTPAEILPPALRKYGTAGLISYSAVEVAFWGTPLTYSTTKFAAEQGGVLPSLSTLPVFFDHDLKVPLLIALLLWPNSWIRNGVAARLADFATGARH